MLRKNVRTHRTRVNLPPLVAALVLGGCSSSSSSVAPGVDGGADGKTTSGKDAGDAGHDGSTVKKEAGSEGGSGEGGTLPPSAPVARFKLAGAALPDYLDVPFPSDVYLANGVIVDPIPGIQKVVTGNSQFLGFGGLNGFSRVALTEFYIDDVGGEGGVADLDPKSLPSDEAASVSDTSAVYLLDLAASGAAARLPARAEYHDDRAFTTSGYRPALAVGPGRGYVLEEGHRYATVVTSRVLTKGGKHVAASKDFLALAASKSESTVYTTAYNQAKALLASALAKDGATIVDLAPYTTSAETHVLLDLRAHLNSVAVPPLSWEPSDLAPMGKALFAAGDTVPLGFTDTLDHFLGKTTVTLPDGGADPNADLPVRAHDRIAAIGTAVFQAENYLSPSNGYGDPTDATFTFKDGAVVNDPTHAKLPIWVTFFIPTAPMPPNGYPVVIVQHGLGESRADEAFNLANTFTSQGWVVAAIDSITFGARAPETKYQVDLVNNFAGGGGSYSGPDGLADAVGGSTNGPNDFFAELLNMNSIRDQFRQAEIDTAQLARVLESDPDLSPLTTDGHTPHLDPTKVAYFGNSLGAMEGAAAAAIEPTIQNWVLNVAGGGVLIELAPHAPLIAALDLLVAGANFGADGDHLTESHPLMNLLQMGVDPGDPLDFAPYVVRHPATEGSTKLTPKNILQIQVVYDEYVANEANEALARGLGIGLATPNVGTNSGVETLGMVRDPSTIRDRLKLKDVDPDSAGLIHDTPVEGTTAVLVQTMPGQHGDNFQQGLAQHNFAIPYNQFTEQKPFVALGTGSAAKDPVFSITCSYLQQQAMAVRFLADGFAGNVPNVTGFKPAVRDFDGDGVPDETDSDPNNPKVH